ncbi:uncharacterized protein PODANS_6_1370 [Podospora anserina S mat+]|uniref:NADPH:adrenodoxin oxidoreductase, mitochondrial n=1 Tax=Podospora anserina (strain S / ATCC MYA-4624 / DSM 980 / FGSC 10383) TaxID=515849 RepID=B2B317_PODAN|nr:uncharacterized protein PODANS_6_1370 [Podospora anserina S mat+]CAP71503.1 unnamed protein product [Podospora anserina S mat+]CDP30899.1 Putative Mitochondrial precursor of adrenodoxin oxidoreductase [Podospora anserina S mat+]
MATIAQARPRAFQQWTRQLALAYTNQVRRASTTVEPFRLAIIGSGPAGFYTAYRFMKNNEHAKVDMYESLPVPYGLVRFGVAPDHAEVKNCREKFEEVAASPDFTFIGNVTVGASSDHPDGATVPLSSILRHYHAVVFSYGSSEDRKLGIPGEELKGVFSAREFVGWYNGLPEYADLNPDLSLGAHGDTLIIGNGNVAMDVARILLKSPEELAKTDIAAHALDALSKSKTHNIRIIGRRGPIQAAFTTKELRALYKLPGVEVRPYELEHPTAYDVLPPPIKRRTELLSKGSSLPPNPSNPYPSVTFDFCLSPLEFDHKPEQPSSTPPNWVTSATFGKTVLQNPHQHHPSTDYETNNHREYYNQKATARLPPQPKTVTFNTRYVFKSIGYKSTPLPEFSPLGIPFNTATGVIPNDGIGRVLTKLHRPHQLPSSSHPAHHQPHIELPHHFKGLYCSGWVKRGPQGVIAETMMDAFTTADAITEDLTKMEKFLPEGEWGQDGKGWEAVKAEALKGNSNARVVSWEDWKAIDRAEIERGQKAGTGKEREKFVRREDMLAVLGDGAR